MDLSLLSKRMFNLGSESAFEVLEKAKKLEAEGKNIIHFEIGEPDFDTPRNIIEAGKTALDEGYTHYTAAQGYLPLREAVTQYALEYKNIKTNPEEVVIVPGGKPIMFYTMTALINPGDEVIYPSPGFPIYESLIRFYGGIPVPLAIREENDFRLDVEELKSKLTTKTKLLLINSPANPTGGVLSEEDIDEIANVLIGKNIFVLSDEIYDRMIYDGSTKSIASIPEMKEWTIVLDGFSKTYAMTGWRLGYGIMNKTLAQKVTDLMINTNSCTAAFAQVAGIEALTGPQHAVDEMKSEFFNRREIIVDGLNGIKGFKCIKSPGAFYAFPNIKDTGMRSSELSDYLMNHAGVAVLSGSSFGAFGEGYLRFSYATSTENIKIALKRIDEAMKKL
ncbi:aminotransferase, class I and II [Alkaliphilus metalliredigens QYMF]|uniref:Aminotransferase n=1 Tax=Alkaliphilus metalliredigens (strain QYMF) TaxID=293826 RepID=A6TTV0_ALKMQ|nr:pyridoxal phosphate-dependent aminotransferase [Alkaliphilus metalliredigens]ABR49618.1 aminotransferase, class I and II [Alkaliphilus metalliredigens QYMF]